MNLRSIKADEALKEDTLNKAKCGVKPSRLKRAKWVIPTVAAMLAVTIGVAAFTGINKRATDEAESGTDTAENTDFMLFSYTDKKTAPIPNPGEETGETLHISEGLTDSAGSSSVEASDSTDGAASNSQQQALNLTASRINDNDSFDSWKKQQSEYENGLFENGYSTLKMSTDNRVAVTVLTADETPVNGATVTLCDARGNGLYKAQTDKSGRAYLFCDFIKGTQDGAPAGVIAELDGACVSAEISKGQTEVTLKFDTSAQLSLKNPEYADIMFLIDTTGSMGDELSYLTKELGTLAKNISGDARFSVNFYRDEGDEYVTKTNDFASVDEAVSALSKEEASGGGDYPEAVDQILEKACGQYAWRENSAKIAFLVLDASAHTNQDAVCARIAEAVKYFASQGIRLVPVMGSDADGETEIMCRQLAVFTGGQFVFLTDNSGIGNSHRSPETDVEYEVKPLIDILTDVINDYM